MKCPICSCRYSEMFKFINCESLDNSYLYEDVHIEKCSKCGHLFNVFTDEDKQNLKKYYEIEHTKNTKTAASKRTLNVGINDACSLPYPDNSFDIVILDQVLEHIINLKSAMKEIKRVLGKGGLCYINVPDAERYDDMYWYILREHVQHFKLSNLKLLAQSNGFELIAYTKDELEMVGTLHLPNLRVVFKVCHSKVYCWGIGREFMYLYPNTRLKFMNITLVDDIKQDKTFKGMEIHGSDILKEADKDSFLIITANVHKDILTRKAKELGYKGEIIDV